MEWTILFSRMVHGAVHLIVSAIEFVAVEGFRTATIGRIHLYNHNCGFGRPLEYRTKRGIDDQEKRSASLKKQRGPFERPYPLDRATSLVLSAEFSLPEDWNSMSGNCSTARRRDCSQLE